MTSATLLHVLSAHRRLLLAGALLGVLLAALAALFVPPTYDATTSIYVTARASGDDPTSAYQGTLLSQDRIASYRALATSHRVLVPVVEQQGRAEPAEDLAGRISVTAAPESTVLSLTVSGPDPVQDAETANAVAGRLVAVVGELERSARSGVQLETVDPARPAVRPSSPGLATTAPVAAVAGLIVAAGVALVRHTTDRRVGHRLPALSGAPLLGRLPVHPRRARDGSRLGSPEVTDGARRLRTAVTARGGNRAVLAVASAVRGEGRTTTALALAAAFAGTERVAVVEADLRNPGIAGLLGLPPDRGLAEVLAGRATLGDAMLRWDAAGVDVLVAGGPGAGLGADLQGPAMAGVLALLRERYDVVLVDGPAVRESSEAVELARLADGVLLVCRTDSTGADELTAAVDELGAVHVTPMGSVDTGGHASDRDTEPTAAPTRDPDVLEPDPDRPGDTGRYRHRARRALPGRSR
ncbi:Tyrosine-protein kinase EpsD [Pseudonocardia sp. Ae406_Ps2]|uniref:polysaccharide biosynthesis tyrosine autokinase n=2 Tax=Pseudonocardia TaxID=1847 RepID=UPI00094B2DF2|nr:MULTISPECIES: polysaccharide biosynthesis tyrosine autokinase [unclassified Pseudonocardia]OLL97022.1 Tyrosine-protein kinase EpsD [Pseudonocardia sp. Ae331_Ps2]OLM05271.1 Tyrosine-protein kinase EpsD [Pseudonocardia sp. Ae406_Ps2]OLM26839.1 Tyrosine-protein kinase EpsD [Pseudonocardia sp. Ae706_Ps2]OLM33098.1 Tyrosine-protein kinase EpsD [Pseudonocardia sp. Ae717_Ps2]